MARSRNRPDPGDDQIDLDELLEEVRGMRSERDELRSALEELRQASTSTQRRRAERHVETAETGLAKALRDAGYHDVSEADLDDLRRSRRRAEFDEWLAETEAARAAADEADDEKSKKRKGKAKPPAADDDGEATPPRRRGYFE